MRSLAVALLTLTTACASSVAPADETGFARALLARSDRAAAALPAPVDAGETADPTGLPDLPAVPARPEAEVREGAVLVSAERLEKLAGIAADEERLTEFLADPVAPEDFAALAFLRSPAVAAARERLRAARTGYAQSADLADLVSLYRGFARGSAAAAGPGPVAPYPDVTALSGEVVVRTVGIAYEELRQAVREVVASAERAHADAARLAVALGIRAEDLALNRSLLETLRARLESGRASQTGYLAFASRVEELATELAVLEESRAVVRAKLNRLLSRPEDAPIDLGLAFSAPGPLPDRDDANRIVAVALDERPAMRQAALAAERAELAVRLAERMTLPRIDVATATPAAGRAAFGVREAQVTEMRARADAMEAAAAATKDTVRTEAREALFALDAAARRLRLNESQVVPLAARALESARGAFEGNRATYLDLLDAVRKDLSARLALADARRDLSHARAGLLLATGVHPTEER